MKKSKAAYWSKVAKTEEEVNSLKVNMAAAKPILNLLSNYIDEAIAQTFSNEEDFEDVNWSLKTASNSGSRKALKKIKYLLDNSNI